MIRRSHNPPVVGSIPTRPTRPTGTAPLAQCQPRLVVLLGSILGQAMWLLVKVNARSFGHVI